VSYIGVQPTAGQYRKLDDISASFNGSTTSFTTSVGGTNVTAGTAQQLLVSVGGVIQEPDADYTVSTNTITFTTAPASGLDFFAILMGDALNTVTTSDGSITTAKLAGSLSVGLAAGTNSAPSLYFTGDSNTGVYSPGADQVAVTTGGTARLTIDSSGNVNIDSNTLYVDAANNRVGLGTSSPAQALDVRTATGNAYINVGRNSQSAGQVAVSLGGGTSGTDWILYQPTSSNDFRIFGNSGDRVTVTSGGNVGIGTTNPGAQNTATALVVGNTSQNNGITILTGTNNDGVLNFNDGENTNLRGYLIYEHSTDSLRFGANGSERGRFDSSGRLLVGTSSARDNFFNTSGLGGRLQIEGSNSQAQRVISNVYGQSNGSGPIFVLAKHRSDSVGGTTVVQSGDYCGEISWQGSDGTEFVELANIAGVVDGTPGANDMPGRLVFSTTADGASSPTERMRIKETGHTKFSNTGSYRFVGTGNHEFVNSLNTVGLDVYNTNASLTSTVLQISADRNTTNGTYNLIQASRIGNADVLRVLDSGNVQNANNSYGAFSDIKLKENVVDATSQWNDLKALQVRKYNFKEETGNSTHTQIGLIAQEAELVSPGLVSETVDRDEEGNDLGTVTKSLNYSVLYMKAVKALQEAMERIEQLETEMAEVKAQLQAS